MAKITKDMTISQIIEIGDRKAAEIFFEHGMGCLGCAMASGENLEQACAAHGIELDSILEKLNAAVE